MMQAYENVFGLLRVTLSLTHSGKSAISAGIFLTR